MNLKVYLTNLDQKDIIFLCFVFRKQMKIKKYFNLYNPNKSCNKFFFKFWFSLLFLASFLCFVKWDYQWFLDQLKIMNVSVDSLLNSDVVPRYDLAKLLNAVECKDCISPRQDMIDKYNSNFWNDFLKIPWKDFDDIIYHGWIFRDQMYFYCVAYVADNDYMRWYPKNTSPICAWGFCGSWNVTVAEFLQVIINLISKYIYNSISINRSDAGKWLNRLDKNSYEFKTLNVDDIRIINQNSKICWTNVCLLTNQDEVSTYLKYCMFNLGKCWMQPIGKIKQWTWPVAEINLLYNQSIITIKKWEWDNIAKTINWNDVLEILYSLNKKIDCNRNNDYDCDGVENSKDNCQNTYNPTQTNTDLDKMGDVCDNDIDWDGIKNPLSIVDDQWRISVKSLIGRKDALDNCLFVSNFDQADSNLDGVGNVCEKYQDQIWIYILIDKIDGSAPLTIEFQAIVEWNFKEVIWDFGDGTSWIGQQISHTFLKPGMYNISAIAKWEKSQSKSETIVVVWSNTQNQKWLQPKVTILWLLYPGDITLGASSLWSVSDLEWNFDDGTKIKKLPNEIFQRAYLNTWNNPIVIKAYENWGLVAVSSFVVGIWKNGKWSMIKSNMLNPEINQKTDFKTTTYNIKNSDISFTQRDFGDGTIEKNNSLSTSHIYKKPWKKVVLQDLFLVDGTKLTSFITIYVVDKSALNSYALIMKPSALYLNVWKKIWFDTYVVWDKVNDANLFVTRYSPLFMDKISSDINLPYKSSYIYIKNWIYQPWSMLYINQCNYLKSQITVVAKWTDVCLQAKKDGTLKFHCDFDHDGAPDICSDDIDWDGIKNLIGVVEYDNADCSWDINNVDMKLLKKHFAWVCTLDNCPFQSNKEQFDLNLNWIWDICENDGISNNVWNIDTSETSNDRDGDGIIDWQDICPDVKGLNSSTWCPDVGDELNCPNVIFPWYPSDINLPLISSACNQCPCQYSDFAADLTNDDQLQAVLRDTKKQNPYKYSLPWIVQY